MTSSPTINVLPPELLAIVVSHFQSVPSSLLRIALVQRSWTIRALDLLYHEIGLSRSEQTTMLANLTPPKFLQKTRKLEIRYSTEWDLELEVILRGVVELRVLHLMYCLREVPVDLFGCPSLQNLEVLEIYSYFEEAWPGAPAEKLLANQITTPTQLQSLSVGLRPENLSGIQNLVEACLSTPIPRLKTLAVDGGQEYLKTILPLAPFLSTFTSNYIETATQGDPEPLYQLTNFLHQATSLTHLYLDVDDLEGDEIHILLSALACPLQSLTLKSPSGPLQSETFAKLKNLCGVFTTDNLRNLSQLTVEHSFRMAVLTGNGAWKDLRVTLEKNGTTLKSR